jgi:hypothetical protein
MWGLKSRKKVLITYILICLITLLLLGTTIEAKERTNDISQELVNKKKVN